LRIDVAVYCVLVYNWPQSNCHCHSTLHEFLRRLICSVLLYSYLLLLVFFSLALLMLSLLSYNLVCFMAVFTTNKDVSIGYVRLPSRIISFCQLHLQTKAVCCAVDGGWCDWSDWTECYSEVTIRRRSRRCECPPPVNGGENCQGERSRTL